MAELRLTIGQFTQFVAAPNAQASAELDAFARFLGAGAADSNDSKARRVLKHLARLIRDGAYQQRLRDAVLAAEDEFATSNPPQPEWGD